ncbi:MAG: energy transducer TonB [Alphaproteobacteria bacterium]|nr:energy transducer TonB [Alphaproteobacteria bacterium]
MVFALPRYLVAIPLAVLITVGLFMVMRFMVAQEFKLPEADEQIEIRITRIEEPDKIIEPDSPLDKPNVENAPPPPPVDLAKAAPQTLQGGGIPVPDIGSIQFTPGTITSDSPTLISILPEYPPSYSGRITYPVKVLLEYDVTAEGKTENVKVVSTEPPDAPGAFRDAAVRALERARFKPALDDSGRPKASFGNQLILTFDPEQV